MSEQDRDNTMVGLPERGAGLPVRALDASASGITPSRGYVEHAYRAPRTRLLCFGIESLVKVMPPLGAALLFLLAATAAPAAETRVVTGVHGPEGPLIVDGMLYFVGWNDDRLWKWDGHRKVVVQTLKGCGHNGLALTSRRTLLLACTNDPGAILELTLDGRQLRRWDVDANGGKFVGGINDIAIAPDGGAYATTFGSYDGKSPPGELVGEILHLAPGTTEWRVVADGLNYANGVGVSPDGRTLYVSQTVSGSMLKFAIMSGGDLSHRSNFALLDSLVPRRSSSPWLGPDSLKVDHHGDIYVAQFYGGKILKLSPAGELLHVFGVAAGDGTTNLAFDEGEKHLYVTVVADAKDPSALGSIVRLHNEP